MSSLGILEKRFYQKKQPLLIPANHPLAKIIIGVLAKGLLKRNFFSLDDVYNHI